MLIMGSEVLFTLKNWNNINIIDLIEKIMHSSQNPSFHWVYLSLNIALQEMNEFA
jgi:hypothetical protein